MDRSGLAYGFGCQRIEETNELQFTGTFLNDMRHGIGTSKLSKRAYIVVVTHLKKRAQAGYWFNDKKVYDFPDFTQQQVVSKVERFTKEFMKRVGGGNRQAEKFIDELFNVYS